jgi:hypothetical protein
MSLNIFFTISCILLDAHIVQFGTNFDNHLEIHLTYRKKVNQFTPYMYSITYKNILVYIR